MLVIPISLFLLGIIMILIVSHYLLEYACAIGEAFGLSETLIGILILGLGTSMPEIVISLYSHLTHHDELLVGNILGSNIANGLLVMGICLLFGKKENIHFSDFKKSYVILLVLSAYLFIKSYFLVFDWPDSLVVIFVSAFSFVRSPKVLNKPQKFSKLNLKILLNLGVLLVLFGLIFLSAHIIVVTGLQISKMIHMTETSFGALFIAISTSLPEIAVSFAAARKRKMGLVFSTVIGSNIANIGFALGFSGLLKPLMLNMPGVFQLSLLALVSSALVGLWSKSPAKMGRMEGLFLLMAYGMFVVFSL